MFKESLVVACESTKHADNDVLVMLQAGTAADDDRAERLILTLDQCKYSQLKQLYEALTAVGQHRVVMLLRKD